MPTQCCARVIASLLLAVTCAASPPQPAVISVLTASSQQPATGHNAAREGDQSRAPSAGRAEQPAAPGVRGTDALPLTVKVLPAAKTAQEVADEKAAREDQSAAGWWLVRLTGLLALIAAIQTVVFGMQAYRLKQTINKMEEIATGQTTDMQNSIKEAGRAARAMEGIAESMALSVTSVRDSVAISRDIAERQKLVTELAGRAYLTVAFDSAIYQDETHIFEAIANVSNRGSTPAYEVTFRAASAIVEFPIADEFTFPLSEANAGHSVSIIGPGMNKILRRAVDGRVPDEEVASIKAGGPRCLLMWGVVDYRDAFHEPRYVKFAFSVYWAGTRPDGTPIIMSADTAHHNDSN